MSSAAAPPAAIRALRVSYSLVSLLVGIACADSTSQPGADAQSAVGADSGAVVPEGGTTSDPDAGDAGAPGDTGIAPVAASCFELLDGTGAVLSSDATNLSYARSQASPNGSLHRVVVSKDAVYAAGNVAGAGPHMFGGFSLGSDTTSHFIAKLGSDGRAAWASAIAGVSLGASGSISARSAGVVFAINSSTAITIGGKTHTPASRSLVIALLGSDGMASAIFGFPITASDVQGFVAGVDSADRMVLVFSGPVALGKGPANCKDTLARIDKTGAVLWARCLNSLAATAPGLFTVDGTTVTESGALYISGYPGGGPYDLGLGARSVEAEAGASYLAKIGTDGKTEWDRRFIRAYAFNLAAIPGSDDVLAAGGMPGNFADGAVVIADLPKKKCGAAGPREHITRLSSGGAVLWSRSFLDTTVQSLFADADGGFAYYSQISPITAGAPTAARATVARVNGAGKLLWQQGLEKFGDPTQGPGLTAAGIDPMGGVVMFGSLNYPVSVGSVPVGSATGQSDLIARRAP